MKDFKKEELVQPYTAVYCETEEEAIELLTWADSIGLRWGGGRSYLKETNFHRCTDTAYSLYTSTYGRLKYWESSNYKIINFKDIKEKTMTKQDLKTGMLVKCKNGDVRLVLGDTLIGASGGVGGSYLDKYTNDLVCTYRSEYTIVEVYSEPKHADGLSGSLDFWSENNYQELLGHTGILWTRPEKVEEMTLAEVCRALGKDIKIVK